MPRSRWLIAAAALLVTFGLSVPAANAAVTTTDAAFTYTGTWNVVTGTQHEHWTAQNGATARINFTTSTAGQTVTLRGVKGATSGNHTANAVIDAATPVVLDEGTGTGTTQNAVVGTSGPLPAGNHTLTLTVTRPEFSIQNLSLTAGSFGGPGYTPGGGTGGGTGTNSGTSAPVGDLPGWHQVYVDNFEAAASSANLTTVYPRLFPYTDNSSYARANLSASGGTLNINEGSDGRGAAVVITAPSTGWGQTYGRYDIEFRADAANNFGSAFLLWPDSEVWGDGETDYPEGNFADQIHVYNHCLGANAPSNCLTVNTGASWQTWHRATIDWTPTAVTFYLDGTQIGRDTTAVATTGRHWVIQMAGSAGSQVGKLQIDWAALYARA
jgi:hypothetical protein